MQVIPLIPLDYALTYDWHDLLAVGQIVQIPFRARYISGVVWNHTGEPYQGVVKSIDSLCPFILPPEILKFIQWVAHYNMVPLGLALKFCLSRGVFEKTTKLLPFSYSLNLFPLSSLQQAVSDSIQDPKPYLIDGVTGSGKTEIYFHKLAQVLKQGKQGLVLIPEIALTKQWVERFERAFGLPPLLWHSHMTPLQRRKTWQTTIQKEPCIVVGARSALFLPFQNLGLIIVDEEHDSSFKQNEPPFYHARDMAIVRAHLSKIPILLGSATPSLETYHAARSKRYIHLTLSKRFGEAVFPKVHVINMKDNKGWIAPEVKEAIRQGLYERTQTLIYLNRRGYAPLCLCTGCGYKIECKSCHHPLTLHQIKQKLLCHRCGFSKLPVSRCPKCEKDNPWKLCGPGVERIEEILIRYFPKGRFLTLSSDAKFNVEKIINHEVDIIIGTQILAKGHHFPLLTRVIVLDADMGLLGNDFRGLERTFQILHQVAGRAGRETFEGHVWVQTLYPRHPMIECLINHDRDKLYELELIQREHVGAPPFCRYVALILSGYNAETVEKYAKLMHFACPKENDIEVLGPAPAPFAKLRGKYRWRFLIKGPGLLQDFVRVWLEPIKIPTTIHLNVDIDPYDFY